MTVPSAPRRPAQRSLHGETVLDDYAWLRNRDDPDVLSYLEAENAHTEKVTAHLAEMRETVFEEIRTRTQETDLSAPARKGDWWYATSTEEGKQYPTYVRMAGAVDGPEQVLLDVNLLAEGQEYTRVGVFAVSPDHSRLAYSIDTDGSEYYTMRVRDLDTGSDLPDVISNTYYSAAWSEDGDYVFYTTVDAAHRPDKVWRHRLGTDPSADVVVFEEPDERMFVSVTSSQDERYLLITTGSQTTSDAHYLRSDDPTGAFLPVLPRVHGVEYSVDHKDGRWLVVTNADAPNGKLVSIPVGGDPEPVELIPHDPARKIADVLALRDHIVVSGRIDGLSAVTIISDDTEPVRLLFEEEVHTVHPRNNLEYDTATLRVTYQSLATPPRVLDIDLDTGAQTLVKETPVLGGFDRTEYVSYREWAVSPDGARIPISIVHRADLDRSRPAPLVLYGYGSYEITIDPYFSVARLSLLDRGVVFAVAHVRGGGAMGKLWYEDGKMANKHNTFADFITCAEHLISTGHTTPELLAARGGSAGGLLMGVVANLRPDLFRAIVAEVPFVDVINTMLDETLPLTVIEWEEWGNPNQAEQYRWMRAYAPYENVAEVEHPAMLVTAGLNDPRVAYWEPAKWVAKLRARARTRGPLLLKTEMGAGHSGPSGRYNAWRDEAFVLSFLLDQWGLAVQSAPAG